MSSTVRRGIRPRDVVLAAITAAILAGVYLVGTTLWDKQFGPTQAKAPDCRLAQSVIDRAQSIPSEKKELTAAYQAYRMQWETIQDLGLKTAVARYLNVAFAEAGYGDPSGLTVAQITANIGEATKKADGHCRSADVKLTMPPYAASTR